MFFQQIGHQSLCKEPKHRGKMCVKGGVLTWFLNKMASTRHTTKVRVVTKHSTKSLTDKVIMNWIKRSFTSKYVPPFLVLFFFKHFIAIKAIKPRRRILRVKETERTRKEQHSRKQKITIDVVFKFVKIKLDWKSRSRKWVPQVRSAGDH